MSTEIRRFWGLALTVCAALAVAAVGLGAANATRGPELLSATIATDRAVATGERLVLRGRQPLEEVTPGQVEITPHVPFTVETRDAQVVVTFSRPLAYGTSSTVTVTGARSRHTGAVSDWTTSFTTPPYAVYSLVGAGPWGFGSEDAVLRTDPSTGESTTVLVAPGLDDYTVVDGVVVAISRGGQPTAGLVAVTPAGGDPVPLSLPEGTEPGLLQGSPENGVFGYTLTGGDHDNTLVLQDAHDLGAPPRELTGATGTPLQVTDWAFVPGTKSLVVQDQTGQVLLAGIDPGASLIPLGSHDLLLGFLPGTTTFVVQDGAGEVSIDLATGTSTPLAPIEDAGSEDVMAGERTMIGTNEWVQQFDDLVDAGGQTTVVSRLAHTADGTTQTVTTVPPSEGRLVGSGVSANGQYAWAVVLDPHAPVEDLTSGATNHCTTRLIDLTTGETVASVPGAHVRWITE